MKKIIICTIAFLICTHLFSQKQSVPCIWDYTPFTPSILFGKQGSTINAGVQQYTLPSDCPKQKYIWTFSDGTTIINWDSGNNGVGTDFVSHTFPPVPFNVMHQVCLEIECYTNFVNAVSCKSQKVCIDFPVYACESRNVDLGKDVQVCDDDVNFVLDAGPGWPSYKWFKFPSNTVIGTGQTLHPTSSGKYIVEVSDPLGGKWCTKKDEVEVTLIDCNACNISVGYQSKQLGFCRLLFNGSATATGGTQTIGYHWDFGDGTTSTDKNPLHQYNSSGTYTVTLTVIGRTKNGQCCTQSFTNQVNVNCDNTSCLLKADFSFNKKGKYTMQFTNNSISNNATEIVGYYWDFGNGNTSTDENPTFNFNSNGFYNVCLTVYGLDDQGNCCEDTYCRYVWIWSLNKLDLLMKDDSFNKVTINDDGNLKLKEVSRKEWDKAVRRIQKIDLQKD